MPATTVAKPLAQDGGAAVRFPSLTEIAYQRVREAILRGVFAAGQPLGQEELAKRIGTSRVPLREALQRLEAEGLVMARPRRGYVVTSLDPEEIKDIFDIRMVLEERAGHLATLRATQDDIAAVEKLLRAMEGLSIGNAKDASRFAERNRAFHERLYASSGRVHLCRLLIMLRANVERYIRIGAQIAGNLERVRTEHEQIFNAFSRRDAKAVARLCRAHCQGTGERLIERLKREKQAS